MLTRTHSLHPHRFVFEATSTAPTRDLGRPLPAGGCRGGRLGWRRRHGAVLSRATGCHPGLPSPTPGRRSVGLPQQGLALPLPFHLRHGQRRTRSDPHHCDPQPGRPVQRGRHPPRPRRPGRPVPGRGPALLPSGSATGSPTTLRCFPFVDPPLVLPGLLFCSGCPRTKLYSCAAADHHDDCTSTSPTTKCRRCRAHSSSGPPWWAAEHLDLLHQFCLPVYRTPPNKLLILQLYHSLKNAAMVINGRKYLWNTPTILAWLDTKMRSVSSACSDAHTFHLHGHRSPCPARTATTSAPSGQPAATPCPSSSTYGCSVPQTPSPSRSTVRPAASCGPVARPSTTPSASGTCTATC